MEATIAPSSRQRDGKSDERKRPRGVPRSYVGSSYVCDWSLVRLAKPTADTDEARKLPRSVHDEPVETFSTIPGCYLG